MPWRTAPAWPDSPPPVTLTMMSNVPSWLVSTSGWRTTMRPVSREKNSSTGFSLTTILPDALLDEDARDRRLAAARAVVVVADHGQMSSGLGLLRRVRVRRARVALELLDHLVAERALGQHALDGLLERAAREARLHLRERRRRDAARVARVAVVELVVGLVAGHAELVDVGHDDEVARVHVRRVDRLVLAAQAERDLAGEAAQHLVGARRRRTSPGGCRWAWRKRSSWVNSGRLRWLVRRKPRGPGRGRGGAGRHAARGLRLPRRPRACPDEGGGGPASAKSCILIRFRSPGQLRARDGNGRAGSPGRGPEECRLGGAAEESAGAVRRRTEAVAYCAAASQWPLRHCSTSPAAVRKVQSPPGCAAMREAWTRMGAER